MRLVAGAAALPAASVATARRPSLTDFAFLSALRAVAVSFALAAGGVGPKGRAGVPTTTALRPSLSFFAVALSIVSWIWIMHGSSQAALRARPLARTALRFWAATTIEATGGVVSRFF